MKIPPLSKLAWQQASLDGLQNADKILLNPDRGVFIMEILGLMAAICGPTMLFVVATWGKLK